MTPIKRRQEERVKGLWTVGQKRKGNPSTEKERERLGTWERVIKPWD